MEAVIAMLLTSNDDGIHSSTVRIFHPSLRDFLLDRCQDSALRIDETKSHHDIAMNCLRILNKQLRQNICNIEEPWIANRELNNDGLLTRLQSHVPDVVRYACAYWPVHIALAGAPNDDLIRLLSEFALKHLLHWAELLSLLSIVPQAIKALLSVKSWCEVSTSLIVAGCVIIESTSAS
jgi:hypothetical protein